MATLSARRSTPSSRSFPKRNPNPKQHRNQTTTTRFPSTTHHEPQKSPTPTLSERSDLTVESNSSPPQQQQTNTAESEHVVVDEGYSTTTTTSSSANSPSAPQNPSPNNTNTTSAAALDGTNLSSTQSSDPSLLHLCFNQDQSCFAVGTTRGFRVYISDPFFESFRRESSGGGIGTVEMLFRCNIIALIEGGSEPQYPRNKVMIWDDHSRRCIGELSFRSEVRAVRLRSDGIIVVVEQKIFVYNFTNLKLLHQIETIVNPKGLCAVSYGSGSLVLVCPGMRNGQVRVEHYGSKRTKFIMAHDSMIACLALTPDGKLLATASTKGTLIRVYNTSNGTLLQEVRRGAHRAEIHSLAFSSDAQWLAVSSDNGTVHVFSLKVNLGSPANEKPPDAADMNHAVPASSLSISFIKGVLPKYFKSEWSVAQFRLQEGSHYIVGFGHQKNTVVIIGMDGSFYRCEFDPNTGGEMKQLEYHNFLKSEEAF